MVGSNPSGAWLFVCCVLSGRGLCDELITRQEESWCVVVCNPETSRVRRPWPAHGRSATENIYKRRICLTLVHAAETSEIAKYATDSQPTLQKHECIQFIQFWAELITNCTEAFALLGSYVAQVRSWIPTFRYDPSGPIFKRQEVHSPQTAWPLNMEPVGWPET